MTEKELIKELEKRFNLFYEDVLKMSEKGYLDKGMFVSFRYFLMDLAKTTEKLSEEGKDALDKIFDGIIDKLYDNGIELNQDDDDPTILYIRKIDSDDDY